MHEQRIAVGLRLRHLRGADGAARAGPVLDDGGLAELRGEFFGDRARHDVGAAPGSEGNDDPDRLRRPGLRLRAGMHGAQRQCSYRSTQFSGHSFLPSGLPRGKARRLPRVRVGRRARRRYLRRPASSAMPTKTITTASMMMPTRMSMAITSRFGRYGARYADGPLRFRPS